MNLSGEEDTSCATKPWNAIYDVYNLLKHIYKHTQHNSNIICLYIYNATYIEYAVRMSIYLQFECILKHKSSRRRFAMWKEHHDHGNGWEEGPQDLEHILYIV